MRGEKLQKRKKEKKRKARKKTVERQVGKYENYIIHNLNDLGIEVEDFDYQKLEVSYKVDDQTTKTTDECGLLLYIKEGIEAIKSDGKDLRKKVIGKSELVSFFDKHKEQGTVVLTREPKREYARDHKVKLLEIIDLLVAEYCATHDKYGQPRFP